MPRPGPWARGGGRGLGAAPRIPPTTGRCLAVALVAALGVGACTGGGDRVAGQAREAGLVAAVRQGAGFRHVVFRSRAAADGILHVYLGGDGRAWLTPRRVAADPTPRESVALALMARDPAPAVMVGRPCYHGLAAHGRCGPRYWTTRRYAPEGVASMAVVIEAERRRGAGRPRPVLLVGYSGGGTLAVLLAEVLAGVRGVVTVAGNLDVGAWTRHHGFSPLAGSLDPAARPPLPAHLPRLHLAGARDTEVLAAWTRRFAAGRPGAAVRVVEGFDHACCWEAAWPALLEGWR